MYRTDKIAVLLATYNGEKYLEEQINSLLQQSYTEWELFIHDDGSRDRTLEIIENYEQKYPDKIRIMHNVICGGAKENFFFMMRQVRAPYIMFCDQDDVWVSDKMETTLKKMKSTEEKTGAETPILVFSDLSITDSELNILADKMTKYQKLNPDRVNPENLIIQNVVTGCTAMINRALAELAIKPEITDGIIMHDWWCALVASVFGRVVFIDRPLVFYRQHKNNSVGAKKIGSWNYIKNSVQNQSGLRESLRLTWRQSALFAEVYNISWPLFEDYGKLDEKNKSQRLYFYVKNRVRKCGWQRNLGLLIWG